MAILTVIQNTLPAVGQPKPCCIARHAYSVLNLKEQYFCPGKLLTVLVKMIGSRSLDVMLCQDNHSPALAPSQLASISHRDRRAFKKVTTGNFCTRLRLTLSLFQ